MICQTYVQCFICFKAYVGIQKVHIIQISVLSRINLYSTDDLKLSKNGPKCKISTPPPHAKNRLILLFKKELYMCVYVHFTWKLS